MKFTKVVVAVLLSAMLLASCGSSGRMNRGGSCHCNKGYIGY